MPFINDLSQLDSSITNTFVDAPQNQGDATFEGIGKSGGGFGETLLGLFNTGAKIYSAVNPAKTVAKQTTSRKPVNWTLYAGIAVAVLLVGFLLLRRK